MRPRTPAPLLTWAEWEEGSHVARGGGRANLKSHFTRSPHSFPAGMIKVIVSKDACGRDVRTKTSCAVLHSLKSISAGARACTPPLPPHLQGALHVASLALCFVTRALPSIPPLPLLAAKTPLWNFLKEQIPESTRIMSKNSSGTNDLARIVPSTKWLPRGSALHRPLSPTQLTGTLFPAFTMGTFNSALILGVSPSLTCALLNPRSRNELFTVPM